MTEPPAIPGFPIPGFPGYTLDRKPDGSWGIRSGKARRGRPPGRFLNANSQGRIVIPDANGRDVARLPETWAEYVLVDVEPPSSARKLSDEQVRSVFHRYHDLRESGPEISATLGISISGVQRILRGEAYKDVTADLVARYPAPRPSHIPRAPRVVADEAQHGGT